MVEDQGSKVSAFILHDIGAGGGGESPSDPASGPADPGWTRVRAVPGQGGHGQVHHP